MNRYNIISVLGLFLLMLLAWICSTNHRRLNFRLIAWGLTLQLILGALIFMVPASQHVFLRMNDGVLKILESAQAGQKFVFGSLADSKAVGFVLFTQAFPIVIFFSALMGLLYFWRIMPMIICGFARLFTRVMRVSGAESLCTASNIFVGIESVTAIRPYLPRMTRSEYCTILTAGMATVASSTMGIYVLFLADTFPTIAGQLIAASFMSAPAALVMSKLVVPEEEHPVTLGLDVHMEPSEDASWIDAIVNGAMAGLKLVGGIVALLVAFLGLLALADLLIGALTGGHGSLTTILGYVFYPFALAMGIPTADVPFAANLLGQRLIMTEVPAYQTLALGIRAGQMTDSRTAVIMAYALCGFAHIASLAIFVGGIVALAPTRRKDIVAVGPRALLAATLACLMTGAVAGVFFHESGTSLLKLAPAAQSSQLTANIPAITPSDPHTP
ncbi:MAG: nucleoside transporter C-terminal domain-containing protein [Kiritimatiellae bacterium]|nr:nucleoside transporter C-terminal domain-containing protein [Kiritimatiellia bacterium]